MGVRDSLEKIRDVTSTSAASSKLVLVPISYSSGEPNRYLVAGLPDGQSAEIALRKRKFMGSSNQAWKIKRQDVGRYKGCFATSEEALEALRIEMDSPPTVIATIPEGDQE